jgi:hypothetical protein
MSGHLGVTGITSKKNKRKREYLPLFKTKCKGRDCLSLEEFAHWESSIFPSKSFPFKVLDDNGGGKISHQEYEKKKVF